MRSGLARIVAWRVAVSAALAAVVVLHGTSAMAWTIPASVGAEPPCPGIPDVADVVLTPDENARIDAGEIIVHVSGEGAERRTWAVGYLDTNPAWLFDIAMDAGLAHQLSDIIARVDVLELRTNGELMHGVVDPGVLLPSFQYTLAVSYLDDETGQCWVQTQGDFRRNEGSHSYLWDPSRSQTLAVFTFNVSLKGMLALIPDEVVRRLTARTLPDYMRALESYASRLARDDPARAERVADNWSVLRSRLESGELADRVWRQNPVQALAVSATLAPRLADR
jgi:hypothetical protein